VPMTDAETRRERKQLWTWRFGAALTSATRITYLIECHFADMYLAIESTTETIFVGC
jgi:hypothetical protein